MHNTTKTAYEVELQQLKDWDEVQYTETLRGYDFIVTAGHGYLVVPKSDPKYRTASAICNYGFKGKLAVYLEEDVETSEFLQKVGA